ncbi:MAG: trimethylamine methyltransferase family protein, partial [Gammaproteobacteria bacterium]
MTDHRPGARAKRKRRRRPSALSAAAPPPRQLGGIVGGRYQPLNPSDLPVIDQAVRKILQDVGMSEAPEIVIEHVTAAGGSLDQDGRLHFSAELIERALTGLA